MSIEIGIHKVAKLELLPIKDFNLGVDSFATRIINVTNEAGTTIELTCYASSPEFLILKEPT